MLRRPGQMGKSAVLLVVASTLLLVPAPTSQGAPLRTIALHFDKIQVTLLAQRTVPMQILSVYVLATQTCLEAVQRANTATCSKQSECRANALESAHLVRRKTLVTASR